ncbi:MAG TPA: Gfo/Idh/MocA family oxidoreductase [Burkholderiales bacterium]|nr:Gfo/Idh/MocA family oxidoreductase [Burkholderiales bacterium]
MGKVRVAVVGAGHMGRYHAQKFAGCEGAELAAVVDADASRAAAFPGTPFFRDYRQMLDLADAAVIAVPTDRHYAIARACIAHGLHVLMEKPIAGTLAQATTLIRLAKKHRVVLQVGHVERFNRGFAAISARLDRPMYIETERLAPFKARGVEVDVVLDLMIHDLDLVVALARSEVKRVSASGFRVLTRDIDIATAYIEFASGCVANLSASRVSQAAVRKLRMFQSGVYLSADLQSGAVRFATQSGGEVQQTEKNYSGGDALAAQAASFIKAISGKSRVAVSGEDGRRALKLALDVARLVRVRLRRFE